MNHIKIVNDLDLLGVRVDTFPNGIQTAGAKLEENLKSKKGLKFFG